MTKEAKKKNQISLTSFFIKQDVKTGDDNNEHCESIFVEGKNPKSKFAETVYSDSILKRKQQNVPSSRFGVCPICHKNFPLHTLNNHTELCISDITNTSGKIEENKTLPSVTSKMNTCHDEHEFPNKKAKQIIDSINWWEPSKQAQRACSQSIISHSSEPIPGLYIYENFITAEEEEHILASLDNVHENINPRKQDLSNTQPIYNPWKNHNFNGPHFGKRWGVHCNLRDRRVSAPEHLLPSFLTETILPRLRLLDIFVNNYKSGSRFQTARCSEFHPNEANAIDYRKSMGHYLTSHVDDRRLSKEPIANLSLAGDCYMTFRNEKKGQGGKGFALQSSSQVTEPDEQRVLLQGRTLQVLIGKARYNYSHGIRNQDLLSERRVSITIRESPLSF